jgi:hypothetical protein
MFELAYNYNNIKTLQQKQIYKKFGLKEKVNTNRIRFWHDFLLKFAKIHAKSQPIFLFVIVNHYLPPIGGLNNTNVFYHVQK